ncbi:hypothetical protein QJS10_CPB22g00484 [Acorus calamus]|uniref:DUF3444 domain-containing protein n=1 Tax=Acorus calamus TaxID=4465 RepID=A0AAV9BY71_ACOCL|nr:hypothetical protein QJS10_CPB22g00484 [Acorus calamus]
MPGPPSRTSRISATSPSSATSSTSPASTGTASSASSASPFRLPPDVAFRHLLLSSEIAPLGLDFPGASQAFAPLDEARSALTTRRRGGWTAEDLVPGQIWAVRDGSARYPRRYVEVVNWGSITDSEASVFFLEPHPTRDEEMRWVEEGLPFVCGMFRASKEIAHIELSLFSHRVSCDRKLGKSFYRILPKKGEIWAIYADWSGDWGVIDQANCAYRVVEIASEFEAEEGAATVAGLVEVEGCTTFFEREVCDGFRPMRRVSGAEILRFSHRIPAFRVPGIEEWGIPKGAVRLCPGALPLKLNRVRIAYNQVSSDVGCS